MVEFMGFRVGCLKTRMVVKVVMQSTISAFPYVPKTEEDESNPRQRVIKEEVLNVFLGAGPDIIREEMRGKGNGTLVVLDVISPVEDCIAVVEENMGDVFTRVISPQA